MITEDYVSFEVAKLLKKKGFDINCKWWYIDNGKYVTDDLRDIKDYAKSHIHFSHLYDTKVLRPTQSIVMRWLREVHNLHIEVYAIKNFDKTLIEYCASIMPLEFPGTDDGIELSAKFNNNEEAVEAAIKYCLEILI